MSRFLDVPLRAGEIVRERASLGEFADGSPVVLPVVTARGREDGPTVYLQAALHGDESTGVEICRRVLADVDPDRLRGTLVAVPVANVPAYFTRTRGFLHEERWLVDINRVFPGDPGGLLTHRIAHVLFEQFVLAADLTIDLHCALDGCNILPFSYVDPADDEHGTLALRERCALATGLPYAYYKARGSRLGTSDLSASIGAQADKAAAAVVTLEMGESRRVSSEFVPQGVRAVWNALGAVGLVDAPDEQPPAPRRFSEIHTVHADRGGGLRIDVELGDSVREGQEIGQVVDLFGEVIERLRAPIGGVVLRRMLLASVNSGAEVAWIVR